MPGAKLPRAKRRKRRPAGGRHRRRRSGITSRQFAGLAGLYLVCVAIGGLVGLYLDRNGVFDGATPVPGQIAQSDSQELSPQEPEGSAEDLQASVEPEPQDAARDAAVRRTFPYTPRAESPGGGWEDLLAVARRELERSQDKSAETAPADAPEVVATLSAPRAQGKSATAPDDIYSGTAAIETASPKSPDTVLPERPQRDALAALPNLRLPGLEGEAPPWQRYAVPVSLTPGRPLLAVVIDDVGLNRPGAKRAFRLPAPLTMALMSYADHLPALAEEARRAGHELLVHVPMEPDDLSNNPGPEALLLGLSPAEQARRIDWALTRFEGFVGFNNHMGSRFTANADAMSRVIAAARARGLLYLDSRTSPDSKGAAIAERSGVPFAERDVFLDNAFEDAAAIRRQLDEAERVARSRGFAVAIGHPHATTLSVLEDWLPKARQRGIVLVPISAIVRLRLELAQQPIAKAG